jgi:hypothetical protein
MSTSHIERRILVLIPLNTLSTIVDFDLSEEIPESVTEALSYPSTTKVEEGGERVRSEKLCTDDIIDNPIDASAVANSGSPAEPLRGTASETCPQKDDILTNLFPVGGVVLPAQVK